MIDVYIQQFARNLMTVYVGILVYQANLKQKNLGMIKNQTETIQKAKQDSDRWSDMAFDLTSSMIDKRYRSSKEFIGSGGTFGSMKFKKSLSNEQKDAEYFIRQNSLKVRARYENTVSSYNQKMNDQKIRSSVRKIDLRSFF